MAEFGFYVHIPFCVKKCHYCDFNSIEWQPELAGEFLDALMTEVKMIASKYDSSLRSIFIGGGTPTCLDKDALFDLLLLMQQEFELKSDIEVTIEANPGTVNRDKLLMLKKSGVNRLSFGVQSFTGQELQKLGRIHTAQQARDNYYLAREVGFDNINLDLIFAIPGQSLKDWEETLNQALQLAPEHLAIYNLKIEPGTKLAQDLNDGTLESVSKELDLEMYKLTVDSLIKEGYNHYEISNLAHSGYKSKHNQIYWRNEPYLAVGPGAHFYDGEKRGSNLESIKDYIATIKGGELPVSNENYLTRQDKIVETIIMGLRLREGISLAEFESRFGEKVTDIYEEEINKLQEQNLIEVTSSNIRLTWQGLILANDVLAEFVL